MAPGCVQNALTRRCEEREICTATTTACAVLGAAVDAGIVTLDQVLDLVRSCSTSDQLGDALCMLAATVPSQAQPGAVDGYPERMLEVPTWMR